MPRPISAYKYEIKRLATVWVLLIALSVGLKLSPWKDALWVDITIFLGALFAIVYVIYLVYQARLHGGPEQMEEPGRKRLQRLMQEGEMIEVDLMKCEVLETSFYEEKELDPFTAEVYRQSPALALLDSAMSDPLKNNHNKIVRCQVRFVLERNGQTEVFHSPVLHTDRATVLFKAAEYGKTWIWVDRDNRSEYFIDLRFLTKP